MLGGSNLFLGLACGIVGCAVVPLIKSSFFAGGGNSSAEVVSNALQLTQQKEKKQITVPKRDTFIKLLLSGNDTKDGLVVELTRDESENSQWKLQKTTWRGQGWNSNWTLYSDDEGGEYTFTDKRRYEKGTGCWNFARFWGVNKVCEAYGEVNRGEEAKWKNNFPKIRFVGWTTRFKGQGISASPILDTLDKCSVSAVEKKSGESINLTVTISCEDGSLIKTLSSSDLERMTLEKR